MLLVSVLILSVINHVNGNAFNLNELKDDKKYPIDPITKDIEFMNVLDYTVDLIERAEGIENGKITKFFNKKKGRYKKEPEPESLLFIPRMVHTKEAQQKRMRPQYILTYYAPLKSIILFIAGTFSDSKKYDFTNLINVVPKEIILRHKKNEQETVNVHGGVYNAANTAKFYHLLFEDLQKLINNVHEIHFKGLTVDDLWTKAIDKIYITGQSQGGAIATLLYVLWQGNVDCPFVNYFKSQFNGYGGDKHHLKRLLDKSSVFTYGAFGIFGHEDNGSNQIDDKYHDKIINIINAKDPVPMANNGDQPKPKEPFKQNEDTWIDIAKILSGNPMTQAVMDEFDEKAYYGPVGTYIVMIQKGIFKKDVYFKEFEDDENDNNDLFEQHLIFGAETLDRLPLTQWSYCIRFHLDHRMVRYQTNVHKGVARLKGE